MTAQFAKSVSFIASAALCLLPAAARAQKPEQNADRRAEAAPPIAAQIELLETKYRFEANGDSRKEVYARVRINDELGVQQFRQLKFGFNRSYQSVEIPLVRITHEKGGTADILPSAVSDNPNPAVVNFPAYQDVRVKSVRILGLAPGDLLEYRVITTTTHPPLAPDFWLDHTFDRTGVVTEERFELDLPLDERVHTRFNTYQPSDIQSPASNPEYRRSVYHWTRKTANNKSSEDARRRAPDIQVSTFSSWDDLAKCLAGALLPTERQSAELRDRAASLTSSDASPMKKAEDFYDYVSQKVRTIDLPLGATGFRTRRPVEILDSGYATPEDKFVLFSALANNFFGPARAGLISTSEDTSQEVLPAPDEFDHLLTVSGFPSVNFWMDLNLEVAPFRMIPTQFRNKAAFVVGAAVQERWQTVVEWLPFAPTQKVEVSATIDSNGTLSAHVSYSMRGDNELTLRVAFHQTPKEKWEHVAQLLALSDGFRGKVTNVTASDPFETTKPFEVEYNVEQPKFVNWEKRPVRIPAILPLVGLPDPPAGNSAAQIDLGTPLEVDLSATIKLPPGTTAKAPPGTSVARDYAAFSSSYSARGNTVTASRRINFLLRSLPRERALDYNAFVRAVQNDRAQDFTLERADTGLKSAATKP